jgi:hypothetical protein
MELSNAKKSFNAASLYARKDMLITQLNIEEDCSYVSINTKEQYKRLVLSENSVIKSDKNIISIEVEEGNKYLTFDSSDLSERLIYELKIHLNTLLKKKWETHKNRTGKKERSLKSTNIDNACAPQPGGHAAADSVATELRKKSDRFVSYSLAYMTGDNISWDDNLDEIPYAIQRQDSRDLYEMASVLKRHYEMGGFSYRRFHPNLNFIRPTPEIELCDIFEFLKLVAAKRDDTYKNIIYINLCMNSKWYVGITSKYSKHEEYRDDALRRLKEHRDNGGGTNWTWVNPVISTVMFFKGDYVDENLVTQLIAKCVGDDNVRGGCWTDVHSCPLFPTMSVQQIKESIINN